ncbi:MAG: DUF3828 domain-containing protein [Deltaproteobacteria bacterium]|nr:DUF3828 domain-containing protein [Deltaproteobacteria bacterium]
MVTFRIAAAVVALGLSAAPAEDPLARAFVQSIYAHYIGGNTQGVKLDKKSDLKKLFSPQLVAAILADRDAAAKKGDVPNLDGDPFVDAQDWEIAKVDIAISQSAPDRAQATVKFTSADEAKTVVLDLVKLKDGWRVAEVTSGTTKLSAILKGS